MGAKPLYVYALIWGALYVFAFELSAAGAQAEARMLFPIPVACYWMLRRQRAGVGLILGACAVAVATVGTVVGVLEFGLTAGIGMLVGVVLVRRWSLGWGITLVTAGVYAVVAASLLANWQAERLAATEWFQQVTTAMVANSEQREKVEPLIEVIRFVDLEWENLALGSLFSSVLVVVVVGMTFVAWRFRARGIALGPVGMFRTTRTPEWVVWIAIVVSLMWFWEQKWPNEALRSVTWNSAIGLALVYFLNGFSILVYALTVISVKMFLLLAGLFLLFMFGVYPITAVGLFDTWFNFRGLADQFAEAQRMKQQSNDE